MKPIFQHYIRNVLMKVRYVAVYKWPIPQSVVVFKSKAFEKRRGELIQFEQTQKLLATLARM